MAVISIHSLVEAEYRRASGLDLTPSLDTLSSVNNSPPAQLYEVGTFGFVNVVSNLPISELENVVSVQLARSFQDDYYYRIHVRPGKLNLGNILSSQERPIEVWNAYFDSQLLSSVTAVGNDGITLSEPVVPPTYFTGLEARTYDLTVDTSGPPVINATYTFNFVAEQPTLDITGQRVVVWPFMPQTKHSENLEWQTDIIPSFNNEQRIALREAPRQELSYEYQLDSYQFTRAKAFATQWSHRVYGIPVWSELTYVGDIASGTTDILFDTSNADYRAGGSVILWSSDLVFLATEIVDVQADRVVLNLPTEQNFNGVYVAPLRFARTPRGVDFKRGARDITISNVSFTVSDNVDLGETSTFPQYRGLDVLIDRTILVGDLTTRISRSVDEFDNGSGPVEVDIKTSWASYTTFITFDTLTRAQRWDARKWLHSRRGRQKAFWLPSWNNDLTITQNVGSAASAIYVSPIGYPLYYSIKDIFIQLYDGTQIFARVTGATTDVSGDEILSLSAPTGYDFTPSDVEFITFISHVRLNSDKIRITHDYAGRAITSIPVMETPE